MGESDQLRDVVAAVLDKHGGTNEFCEYVTYSEYDELLGDLLAAVRPLLAEKDATIAQLREKITYWQSQCSGLDAELSKARARITELERSDG
jgi:chromosome segregation ATPase